MLKRTFDLLAVLLSAPAWVPVLLAIALLVRIKLGSPVFFRQKRPGLHGRIFEMIKFRTMTDARDPSGQLLPDAVRLTPFGRFLRSTSLDELPELFNVLRGDMSLVGPRPLLIQYLDRYTPRQARRHEVRPGITGLVQVKGRNALTWDEKFEWDVRYVETRSFWLDIKILFLTVKAVLFRTGISAQGDATMPEFVGSQGGARQPKGEG
jgi:sugar transferase EpsL